MLMCFPFQLGIVHKLQIQKCFFTEFFWNVALVSILSVCKCKIASVSLHFKLFPSLHDSGRQAAVLLRHTISHFPPFSPKSQYCFSEWSLACSNLQSILRGNTTTNNTYFPHKMHYFKVNKKNFPWIFLLRALSAPCWRGPSSPLFWPSEGISFPHLMRILNACYSVSSFRTHFRFCQSFLFDFYRQSSQYTQ